MNIKKLNEALDKIKNALQEQGVVYAGRDKKGTVKFNVTVSVVADLIEKQYEDRKSGEVTEVAYELEYKNVPAIEKAIQDQVKKVFEKETGLSGLGVQGGGRSISFTTNTDYWKL